jgi:hypothetical protein
MAPGCPRPGKRDRLPAVAQLLVENAVLVADPVSQGGNLQGCQKVEVAGGEPVEAAVAEPGFGFLGKHRLQLQAEFLHDVTGGF